MDLKVERLPFTVGIATGRDLRDVAKLRAQAYGRHLPGLGARLQQPEPADYETDCQVFLARSKFDGDVLGTLRTHANVHKPLPLEASIELPRRLRGSLMVETTRLSIQGGHGASLVRNALFKALHRYCFDQGVDWMLAAGRHPVDRIYDGLLFEDVMEKRAYYPMAHAAGVPHRVMKLSPGDAKSIWAANAHPLYAFMVETDHPDINLSNARALRVQALATRRQSATAPLFAPIQQSVRRWASFGLHLQAA